MTLWQDLLHDYTLRTVALGAATLGLVSGTLGTYAVLRRQSLLGDAVSHAALPGVALAFLLTGSKQPLVLILGAAATGWLAALKVMTIIRTTRIKSDTALGLVLSVFFGFGLVLLTVIQKRPDANQAGLDHFLFGQAAALLERDLVTMAVLGGIVILVLLMFWKEFKLLAFDPDYGAILGFPMRNLDVLLTTLIVVAIVIGLQMVGVVLMSAMIVAPAAAARQWTDRLGPMILLAGLFGATAGTTGAVLSSLTLHLPTGPTIVLCISVLVMLSLLAAPGRGILWNWFRQLRNRRRLQAEAVLADLFRLASQHARPVAAPHHVAVLRAMSPTRGVGRALRQLAAHGWVRAETGGRWLLTEAGEAEARRQLVAFGGEEEVES
jgi:manganese/zinc/iron transport system permease protein